MAKLSIDDPNLLRLVKVMRASKACFEYGLLAILFQTLGLRFEIQIQLDNCDESIQGLHGHQRDVILMQLEALYKGCSLLCGEGGYGNITIILQCQ